jgi:Protein of unknown function (DUF2029).
MKKTADLIAIAYIAVVFAISAATYLEIVKKAWHRELAYKYHDNYVYLSDYALFYTVGKMVSTGQGRLVYDSTAINRNLPVALGRNDTILLAMPFFMAFMVPFSFLSVHSGFICWILLSVAALAVASCLILKGRQFGTLECALVVICILASQPAWLTLFLGHACFFQYFFIAVFFWALNSKRDLSAAIALALTSIKPQLAIPLAVPALAQSRFKLVGLALLFEVFLMGLSFLALGPAATLNGPLTVLKWDQEHAHIIPRMISVRALLGAVMTQNTSDAVTWLLFVLWLAFTYEIWRRTKSAELMSTAATITIAGGMVFSPHVHIYDAVLMGLAACFVWPRNGFGAFHWCIGFVRLSLWSLFAAYPLVSWYFLPVLVSVTT